MIITQKRQSIIMKKMMVAFMASKATFQFLYMIKNKINVRIPWRPIHLLPMYQKNEHGDLNNTLNIYQTVVNLPSSPWGHQDGAK